MNGRMTAKLSLSLLIFGLCFFFLTPIRANAADQGINVPCIKGCNESMHLEVVSIDSVECTAMVRWYGGSANEPDTPQFCLDELYPVFSVDPDAMKVGDIVHLIGYGVCSSANLTTSLHKCVEKSTANGWGELKTAKAATCTEDGYTNGCYKCNLYGCGRCWTGTDCTQPVTDPDSYTIPALGHDFTKTIEGNTLTYSPCKNSGCDKKGGRLSIHVQNDSIVNINLDGVKSFNEGTDLSVSENQLKYYKFNDSKNKYEEVSGYSQAGSYYVILSIEGDTIGEDFVVRSGAESFKSEKFVYNHDDTGTFETENFLLEVTGTTDLYFSYQSGWSTNPEIEHVDWFTVKVKDNSNVVISRVVLKMVKIDGGEIFAHTVIPGAALKGIGDYLVSTEMMYTRSLELRPYQITTEQNSFAGEEIKEVIVYYYDEANHQHVYDREYDTNLALKKDLSCQGKKIYYKSCVCGAVDNNENNIFERTVGYCDHIINDLYHPKSDKYVKSPATCTDPPVYYYHCERCDEPTKSVVDSQREYTYSNGKPRGHEKASVEDSIRSKDYLATRAHCNKPATYYYSCKYCEAILTETYEYGELGTHARYTIENSSRTDDFLVSAATCSTPAVYYYQCIICKAAMEEKYEYGTAKGHTEVEVGEVLATCTEAGNTAGKYCSECNEILEGMETIAAKGHTVVADEAVPASCTEEGKTAGSHCSACDAVLVAQQKIAMHPNATISPAKAATCITPGKTEGKYCPDCGAILLAQTDIPAKGHTEDETITPATTKKDGLSIKKCSVCNEVLGSDIIPKAFVTLEETAKYTGKAVKQTVKVTDKRGKSISKNNYKLTYKNNTKIGKATVTITFSGNYEGKISKSFNIVKKTIVPSKVSGVKLTAGRKSFKASWKKGSAVTDGYEIQYSTDKNFLTGVRSVKVTKASITAKDIIKLKTKTNYYVRIRAYNKDGKVTAYSSWTVVKKAVKTK